MLIFLVSCLATLGSVIGPHHTRAAGGTSTNTGPPGYFFPESAFRYSRMNAGRSSGLRDVTRLPSTTTSWSRYFAPALRTSSLIAKKQVALRPLRIPAEHSTHAAWQIDPIGFPALSIAATNSRTSGERRR